MYCRLFCAWQALQNMACACMQPRHRAWTLLIPCQGVASRLEAHNISGCLTGAPNGDWVADISAGACAMTRYMLLALASTAPRIACRALFNGSTKLCSWTARDAGPPAASSSGVAMMVISSRLL